MSALLGGICGILITPVLSMNFAQGTMLGLKGFCAAILGGMGNPLGRVAGEQIRANQGRVPIFKFEFL